MPRKEKEHTNGNPNLSMTMLNLVKHLDGEDRGRAVRESISVRYLTSIKKIN